MEHTGRTGGRAVARLLAVCAVLFGLFLMHGAPATAAGGCHGETAVAAPASHAEQVSSHHADTPVAPPAGVRVSQAVPPAPSAGAGSVCVAVAPRDRLLAPVVWVLAALVFTVFYAGAGSGWRAAAGRAGRRGPPGGGRELLLRVCTARR
ncbi:hypothetical protein MHW47_00440 [Streptomyces sp. OfavH-34-F]|uniref:hypothetical protein n=1 Tax=unclassified Streptomyces TaxID=2593676 RepID=UPI00167C0102|nr:MULTISPECIES: hypothetical protein [unclassified Streptomyces]MCG7522923.1 hypothetical protein [Streptomyces sp. OfavH-34-F]MCX5417977.1 hypothetical protein [Streptomyces sp. NBC_00059]GHE39581.1 hypothetical protein GCM10018771_20110 [Streptomyces cellulosae]